FGLGQRLGFDWLSDQAHAVVTQTPWQRDAVTAILEDLTASQKRLTTSVVGKSGNKQSKASSQKLAAWLEEHASEIERHDALLKEWQSAKAVDIAMLTLAARHMASFKA